jgi:hypothetical protein
VRLVQVLAVGEETRPDQAGSARDRMGQQAMNNPWWVWAAIALMILYAVWPGLRRK